MSESPKSIAQHYHERTKYDPETLGLKGQTLDWEKQPIPFKEYKIGTVFDLKPYLRDTDEAVSNDPKIRLWQRLSHLLLHSYGLTAKLPTVAGVHYLRAAPSAGGLYPAEIYLISRGTAILSPGLYHYQPQTHALVQFWENQVWPDLRDACFWHPALENTHLALVTTAVFLRSAWRYQDRAYRRICLDTGHLLGNIELMAAMNDYRPHLIGGFADDILNQLLYLDTSAEGAIAVLALADLLEINENLPISRTALPSETQIDYPNIPDGKLLAYLHEATKLETDSSGSQGWKLLDTEGRLEDKYNFPFCTKISTVTSFLLIGVKIYLV